MPVRTILHYPHPILKTACSPVAAIDGEVSALIDDLVDTMHAGPGSVGVAAPQIGVSLRVCVVDVSQNRLGRENNHGLLALINPEVIRREGAAIMREGCMSVPDYTGDVERATSITVRFLDGKGTVSSFSTGSPLSRPACSAGKNINSVHPESAILKRHWVPAPGHMPTAKHIISNIQ
jgi:peptide deformylase